MNKKIFLFIFFSFLLTAIPLKAFAANDQRNTPTAIACRNAYRNGVSKAQEIYKKDLIAKEELDMRILVLQTQLRECLKKADQRVAGSKTRKP